MMDLAPRIRTFNTRRALKSAPDDGPVKTPIFWHPCSVCGKVDAPFGYGVSLKHNKLGTWYCAEHKLKETR